jgi:hypothetical protein
MFTYVGNARGDVLMGASNSEFCTTTDQDSFRRFSCIKYAIEAWADGFMLRHVRGSTP